MDIRNLPPGLSPSDRCNVRRQRMEEELHVDLKHTALTAEQIGHADEKNCEQMFGAVPVPVGYAGPLAVAFSSGEKAELHLPLATTEGALVASVNRGCKAITLAGGARTAHVHHGVSRSLAFRIPKDVPGKAPGTETKSGVQSFIGFLESKKEQWKLIGEQTSTHLSILSHTIDHHESHVFLTIYADTDEAMGMNMVTIAAQAIGQWSIGAYAGNAEFVTVAGNVDSDKKPSLRTKEHGRGYEVMAEAAIPASIVREHLKAQPKAMIAAAETKILAGSYIAGALGKNMHAANVIAALYLATGQDAAHVVEGSLADTTVKKAKDGLHISVRLPAILVGVRGGGTALPAQQQCLQMLLGQQTGKEPTNLHPCAYIAESIGAAVLAGELSLLAAQASHTLAQAHKQLGR